MKWFEGSISDAISTAKQRKAIFVVYVEGTDEVSTSMGELLNTKSIASQLDPSQFVSIKLVKDSAEHKQFAEIYKLVPVPSIFFIAQNGEPLDIVAGNTQGSTEPRVNAAIEKCKNYLKGITSPIQAVGDISEPVASCSEPIIQQKGNDGQEMDKKNVDEPMVVEQKENVDQENVKKDTDASDETFVSAIETTLTTSLNQSASDHSQAKELEGADGDLSIEDKVERAKKLIIKKNENKKIEEQQKEKEKELERRRVGQEMQKAKLLRHEMELKQFKEEREREKREEAEAKKRILEQIAQDRAERMQRLNTFNPLSASESPDTTTTVPPPDPLSANKAERMQRLNTFNPPPASELRPDTTTTAPPPAPPSSANNNIVRLQFKLPTGEAKTHTFPAETTLTQVRQFIDNNIVLPFSEYQMATVFPRREFTHRDNNLDLRALQLIPSAVILILPVTGAVGVSGGPSWGRVFMNMFWDLVQPLFTVTRYVQNFLFGRPPPPSPPTVQASANPQPSQSPPNLNLGKVRRMLGWQKPKSGFKKRGNIHTLADDSEGNDENNTWNGNSTQQM